MSNKEITLVDRDGYVVSFDQTTKKLVKETRYKPLNFLDLPPDIIGKEIAQYLTQDINDILCYIGICKKIYEYMFTNNGNEKDVKLKKKLEKFRRIILKRRLFPHQVEAIHWMQDRENKKNHNHGVRGGILCLKMGLGKTLTVICHSLLSCDDGPTLVVCSKTLLTEWKKEIENTFHGNRIRLLFYNNAFMSKDEMKNVSNREFHEYDFVFITYDTLSRNSEKYHTRCQEYNSKGQICNVSEFRGNISNKEEKGIDAFYNYKWERIACDEAHTVTGLRTKGYFSIMSLYGETKWSITGTAVKNYDSDIYSLFCFCGLRGIYSKEWSSVTYERLQLNKNILHKNFDDVGIKLPKSHIQQIDVKLTPLERKIYDFFQDKTRLEYKKFVNKQKGQKTPFASVLSLFVRLRQCSIAPCLVHQSLENKKDDIQVKEYIDELHDTLDKDIQDNNEDFDSDEGILGMKSSKSIEVAKIVKNVIEKDEKIIIFSFFTGYLAILSRLFYEELGEESIVVDGKNANRRDYLIDKFRTDPKCKILLITYKVGSFGLNLTNANHCLFCEPWWCPFVEQQAQARIERIGQEKETFIYKLICEDTIEKKLVDLCEGKLDISEKYMSKSNKKEVKMDKEIIGKILGIGNM
jgi:non-specific serine/threonine protein kinase